MTSGRTTPQTELHTSRAFYHTNLCGELVRDQPTKSKPTKGPARPWRSTSRSLWPMSSCTPSFYSLLCSPPLRLIGSPSNTFCRSCACRRRRRPRERKWRPRILPITFSRPVTRPDRLPLAFPFLLPVWALGYVLYCFVCLSLDFCGLVGGTAVLLVAKNLVGIPLTRLTYFYGSS
jgi:hypothetical protein